MPRALGPFLRRGLIAFVLLFTVLGLLFRYMSSDPQEEARTAPSKLDETDSVMFARQSTAPWPYCEAPLTAPGETASLDSAHRNVAWKDTHELRHVYVMARHGDRTPTIWPSEADGFHAKPSEASIPVFPLYSHCDPVVEPSRTGLKRYPDPGWSGNCVLGQLTALGARQLQNMGRFYRLRYQSLFKTEDGHATFRSTDFNRTIASAWHFARGMFHGSSHLPDPASLIITEHPQTDALSLANPALGRSIFADFDLTALSLPAVRAFPTYPWTNSDLGRLFDVFATSRCQGIKACFRTNATNECMSDSDADALLKWADAQFNRLDPAYVDKTGGRAIRELVLAPGRAADLRRGVSVMATHDTTLAVVLRALGYDMPAWPPYASHIAFEAWRSRKGDGETVFRVVYNGEEICGAARRCPILIS
ncbi:hypothetical protein H9P43_000443 [Blastocladiella emersonii ATCC 22665]|nr:hypothetical protein H9P43_000443 [Blastocladiella emersonii ATCC 22665]